MDIVAFIHTQLTLSIEAMTNTLNPHCNPNFVPFHSRTYNDILLNIHVVQGTTVEVVEGAHYSNSPLPRIAQSCPNFSTHMIHSIGCHYLYGQHFQATQKFCVRVVIRERCVTSTYSTTLPAVASFRTTSLLEKCGISTPVMIDVYSKFGCYRIRKLYRFYNTLIDGTVVYKHHISPIYVTLYLVYPVGISLGHLIPAEKRH